MSLETNLSELLFAAEMNFFQRLCFQRLGEEVKCRLSATQTDLDDEDLDDEDDL